MNILNNAVTYECPNGTLEAYEGIDDIDDAKKSFP